jgi:hypothetical protein
MGAPGEALAVTFATWMVQLQNAGITPDDPELAARLAAVGTSADRGTGDAAASSLVAAVAKRLGDAREPAELLAVATKLYGERVGGVMGEGDRDERTTRIRKYQFGRNVPWMARIWERRDGKVGPAWLIVDRVTDEVSAMDPNPWNDIDERVRMPIGEFQVVWELDGCPSIHAQ